MMNESSFVPSVPALKTGLLTTKTCGMWICSVSAAVLVMLWMRENWRSLTLTAWPRS